MKNTITRLRYVWDRISYRNYTGGEYDYLCLYGLRNELELPEMPTPKVIWLCFSKKQPRTKCTTFKISRQKHDAWGCYSVGLDLNDTVLLSVGFEKRLLKMYNAGYRFLEVEYEGDPK